MFLLTGILLCVNSIAYADDPPDDLEVDIGISGDLEVDIGVSGPAELNVGVEGPSEVHIDAGDEVKLNVEAGDESQVFIDEKVNNPTQSPADPSEGSGDVDEHSSRSDTHLPIISGFLAVGLPCFFLIRRKAKNKTRQLNNEKGEEEV